MNHNWQNVDRDGTRGWYRCANCGHRKHIQQQPGGPLIPPPADEKVYWPPQDCGELIATKLDKVKRDINKLLDEHAASTPAIMKLLGEALLECAS